MKSVKIIIATILIFISGYAAAEFTEFLSEEERYNRLTEELDYWINSPIVLDDSIIFYYKGDATRVAVSGEFNNWARTNYMSWNKDSGIWTFSWKTRLAEGEYQYKLIIDDIWVGDPYNTNVIIDKSGIEVTYFELDEEFIPDISYPLWVSNDIYRFHYYQNSVDNVSLVGDFNNWNPYANPMTYLGGGDWQVDIKLKPGFKVYCFVVDGYWIADPDNLDQYSDRLGNVVNVFFVD